MFAVVVCIVIYLQHLQKMVNNSNIFVNNNQSFDGNNESDLLIKMSQKSEPMLESIAIVR